MSEPTPAELATTVRETFGLDDPRGKAADALDALVALAERAAELEREIEELHTRWQNDVARLGHEVNERQQRAGRAEAALWEAKWLLGAGWPRGQEWRDRADIWYQTVRALFPRREARDG